MLPEQVILHNLILDEKFMRKTLPFLKEEYFADKNLKTLYSTIHSYIEEYNCCPTPTALTLAVAALPLKAEEHKVITGLITELSTPQEPQNFEWLLDITQKWCQERAVYNALYQSLKILEGKETKYKKEGIPEILREALAVDFDFQVGHDYLESAEERYAFYHMDEARIPFGIELLNKYTGGGMPRKTLCCTFAPPGGGKSIFLCDHAANCLRRGFNVLYVTLEMAEERIAERIDANLMNVNLDDMYDLPKDIYIKKFERMKAVCKSRLIIKEYAPAGTTAQTIRTLIEELRIKKQFMPDVLIVDYLTLMESFRLTTGNSNSFERYKAVAEELRGIGKMMNISVVSAGQLQRSAYRNTDADMEHVAESAGINNTSDVMFFIISSEELEQLDQRRFKFTKNRLGRKDSTTSFLVGLDSAKMKFFDLDQQPINNSPPASTVSEPPFTSNSGICSNSNDDGDEDCVPHRPPSKKTSDWT